MLVNHRRAIRTTDLLERLFVEEHRRMKIIPNTFGEKPMLKLMFVAMTRTAQHWRVVSVTTLEHRQMETIRRKLNEEYERVTGSNQTPEETRSS